MWNSVIHWLENHTKPCWYKETFGFECLGCGIQTSFIELLKGNIYESIVIYPPLIPIISFFVYTGLFLTFKFNYGLKIMKFAAIGTALTVVFSYLYKILT